MIHLDSAYSTAGDAYYRFFVNFNATDESKHN